MAALLNDEYVSVEQAAHLLEVHKSTIRRWINEGALPAFRVGRRRLALKRADVARLITPARVSTEEGAAMDGPEDAVVRRLSPEQQRRGFEVLAELRRLHEEVRAQLGDRPLSPSWEILAELRDERGRQLS
jgi:excisionase family DNA binding protein